MQITFKIKLIEPLSGEGKRTTCEVVHADPSLLEEAASMKYTMENSERFTDLLMEQGSLSYLESESDLANESCIYHSVKIYHLTVELPKRRHLARIHPTSAKKQIRTQL
jgi:hypothetical protein